MSLPSTGFVSFAGGNLSWQFAKCRILRQIKSSNYFDFVEIYSEKKLFQLAKPEILEFISRNRLGYGHWIWKPIVVLDFLERNPNCDSVLYLDAGCDFNIAKSSRKRWNEYLSYLRNYNAIVFQTPHLEASYTSKELVNRLNSNLNHLQTGQVQAGTILMKREFALEFCEEWLAIMCEDDFKFLRRVLKDELNNTYEMHIDYRYDQSVFSLMIKQSQNIKILSDEETDFSPDWKNGLDFPIFTTRNRSMVPILKDGFFHRGIRRIERKVIKTYNEFKK